MPDEQSEGVEPGGVRQSRQRGDCRILFHKSELPDHLNFDKTHRVFPMRAGQLWQIGSSTPVWRLCPQSQPSGTPQLAR